MTANRILSAHWREGDRVEKLVEKFREFCEANGGIFSVNRATDEAMGILLEEIATCEFPQPKEMTAVVFRDVTGVKKMVDEEGNVHLVANVEEGVNLHYNFSINPRNGEEFYIPVRVGDELEVQAKDANSRLRSLGLAFERDSISKPVSRITFRVAPKWAENRCALAFTLE